MRTDRTPRRLALETLEDRTVPSIDLTGTVHADTFLLRLKAGTTDTLQYSQDGGNSFLDASLTSAQTVNINGLGGKDTLIVDNSNGLVASSAGLTINFDGGRGRDTVILNGSPSGTSAVTETYTAGATADAAALTVTDSGGDSLMLNVTHTSQIQDLLPATQFTVNTGDANNVVVIEKGQVIAGLGTLKIASVDFQGLGSSTGGFDDDNDDDMVEPVAGLSFVPITVAEKTTVNVNAGAGDDLVLLDARSAVSGLQTLNIDGGAGTDRLLQGDVPAGVTVNVTNVEQNLTNAVSDLFIERLYIDRLHRGASANEVAFWKAIFNSPAGPQAVVAGIDGSLEARFGMVQSWYQHFLGRPAEAGGQSFWANLLGSGLTEEQLLTAILSSPEFGNRADGLFSTGTNDQRFIQALYNLVLGRDGEASGLNFWMAQLQNNSRAAVAAAFLGSPENRANLVGNFYAALLDRDADDAGLHGWTNSGFHLGQIRRLFLESTEFFDDRMLSAPLVNFDANGQATVTGTTQDDDDRRLFRIIAPGTGTMTLTSNATGGTVQAEVTDAFGRKLFETDDSSNTGSFAVNDGQKLFLVVRATSDTASSFTVNLSFAAGTSGSTAGDVTFDASGHATLTGTSQNHHDLKVFRLVAPTSGTLAVNVSTTNGTFARVEIETDQGVEVFGTDPNDSINSGTVNLAAGVTYFIVVRAPDDMPAAFSIDLTLS